MPINYKPVGWDTTKFVNPTNMNQMDAGIKSACDAADELEQEVEAVNESLGNVNKMRFNFASTSTDNYHKPWLELEAQFSKLVENGSAFVYGTISAGINYDYHGFLTSEKYADFTVSSYNTGEYYHVYMLNGVWYHEQFALNSDLAKLHIKKDYSANNDFLGVLNDIASNVNDGETANFSFLIDGKDYYFGYISKYDSTKFGGHFISLGGDSYKFTSAIGAVKI